MEQRGITLTVTETALTALVKEGYDPQYGARPLKRAIQKYIEDPVSEQIIAERMLGRSGKGGRLRVSLSKTDIHELEVHFIDQVK